MKIRSYTKICISARAKVVLTASLSQATISPYDTWLQTQYRGSFGSYDQSPSVLGSTTRPFSPSTIDADGDSGSRDVDISDAGAGGGFDGAEFKLSETGAG